MAGNLDAIRKILTTGIGAALMTEESLSKFLSEIKLPRDAKNFLIKQAQRRKEDLANVIAQELKEFLTRINIHEELRKAFIGMKIDVQATIHVDKKGTKINVTKSTTSRPKTRKTKRSPKRKK